MHSISYWYLTRFTPGRGPIRIFHRGHGYLSDLFLDPNTWSQSTTLTVHHLDPAHQRVPVFHPVCT
jgi:hypothetical protein